MTPQDWLNRALDGHVVVSVGQLDPITKRLLNRAVKRGQLITWRAPWLGWLGPKRSHWVRPDLEKASR